MIRSVAIVGGGPAGSSLAIRLSRKGYAVTLIERERFPRQKLCGEFISPECFDHFRELGIDMLSGGGDRIVKTIFYSQSGRSVSIPTEWFGGSTSALGLSRSEMDLRLLQCARNAGAEVHQSTAAIGLVYEKERAAGIWVSAEQKQRRPIYADLVIDATGRSRVLSKLLKRSSAARSPQSISQPSSLVAFKAHLQGAAIDRGRCEIYAFPGGYGGLTNIEGDLANLCFMVRSDVARKFGGKADNVLKELLFRNSRAASALRDAKRPEEWLAASIRSFGESTLDPIQGVFSIGDAAAFVDPFTGSGMLMAMESSEIFAHCVDLCVEQPELLSAAYASAFHRRFAARLRFCHVLRKLAFVPAFATLAVAGLGINNSLTKRIARATRPQMAAAKGILNQR
jgi:flavin-dependent dehydrogenase